LELPVQLLAPRWLRVLREELLASRRGRVALALEFLELRQSFDSLLCF